MVGRLLIALLTMGLAACAAPETVKSVDAKGIVQVCAVTPIGKTDTGLLALRMYCEPE